MKKIATLIAFLALISGCSIKKAAFNSVADLLAPPPSDKPIEGANPMAALTGENDPQLVKEFFPTALKLISEEEWKDIRTQFDEIGYAGYTPDKFSFVSSQDTAITNDSVKLPSGELSLKQLIGIFDTLPVDITFIDSQDSVRYFSESKDRIFVRSRAIIGSHVQNCHPEKSVHIVNQILSDFKSNKRDSADFWLNIGEKTIYIRYFAVRDTQGQYLGTLEVTQDIAPIKKISGEKRIYSHE